MYILFFFEKILLNKIFLNLHKNFYYIKKIKILGYIRKYMKKRMKDEYLFYKH